MSNSSIEILKVLLAEGFPKTKFSIIDQDSSLKILWDSKIVDSPHRREVADLICKYSDEHGRFLPSCYINFPQASDYPQTNIEL